jgi:hypothetical protein
MLVFPLFKIYGGGRRLVIDRFAGDDFEEPEQEEVRSDTTDEGFV